MNLISLLLFFPYKNNQWGIRWCSQYRPKIFVCLYKLGASLFMICSWKWDCFPSSTSFISVRCYVSNVVETIVNIWFYSALFTVKFSNEAVWKTVSTAVLYAQKTFFQSERAVKVRRKLVYLLCPFYFPRYCCYIGWYCCILVCLCYFQTSSLHG